MNFSIKEALQQVAQQEVEFNNLKKTPTLSTTRTEAELQASMALYFSRYFIVFSEVWDVTHKFRIDLVIIHKSDMTRKYPIGVEIKVDAKKTGKDLAAWLKQAMNYSEQNFEGFGKCLIVTCPQISLLYFREGDKLTKHDETGGIPFHNNVCTFIGQFNVGEVQKIDQKNCRIVFNGGMIWDSVYDEFRTANYERLCKR